MADVTREALARPSYRECVAELESLGIMPERAPSLEPIRAALKSAGLMDRIDPDKVIVVAGTNGKGSVTALLTGLLEATGARVGRYTSPHLIETTERIHVGGRDPSPQEFADACQKLKPLIRAHALSHFEALTLLAAWFFFSGEPGPPVDWAVFEVGLGGTWDATNAVPHRHCVVTTIDFDHENLLGRSLASIAANKFGIVPQGGTGPEPTVVHGPLPPEAERVAQGVRAGAGGRWRQAEPARAHVVAGQGSAFAEPRFIAETRWGRVELGLPGQRGADNAAVALTMFEALGFRPETHMGALARVEWPGRMEKIADRPCRVYLSGDHNPQGVQSLIELLRYYPRRRLHLLAGVGKDKDLEGVLEPLAALEGASLYLTETPFRGRDLADYGPWLAKAAGAWPRPEVALREILTRAGPDDLVVVTGSLYLVGALRPRGRGAG